MCILIGNAFTGKSALVNKMTGKGEAKEHEERVDEQRKLETIGINSYNYTVEGVAATFLDTPGLHGGKYDDVKYIRYMKENRCNEADRLLYCNKMSNTRFQQEDRETITNLSLVPRPLPPFQYCTLKMREWPGDEATTRFIILLYACHTDSAFSSQFGGYEIWHGMLKLKYLVNSCFLHGPQI